jgi:hypothetical protein
MRSASKKPRLRTKGGGMCEPRYPSEKSVEGAVILRAYRDQAAITGPHAKPGFSINGQVGDNHQDAVVAVAEVLNQFRHGFTEGGVPEYAEAFRETLDDLIAKHWREEPATRQADPVSPPCFGPARNLERVLATRGSGP